MFGFTLYTICLLSILTAVGIAIASWKFYRDN
jgi:hypothetical protein